MFSKKEDPMAVAKIALKIAVRHLLASKPEILVALTTICSFQEEADLSSVASDVMDQHTDLFVKDPLLRNDLLDILSLLGLTAPTIDVPKSKALMAVICAMV